MSAPLSSPQDGAPPVHPELQRLERKRIERLASELGTEGLAWLAVAPIWTERVAQAASFPTGTLPLAAWLQRAENAALAECESARRADPELGREFWIAESDRSPVLGFLKLPHVLGDQGLRRVTAEVARRLQSTTSGPTLPVALAGWASLAAEAEQPAAAAQRLERAVEQLTQDQRLGEAKAAVTAGDALARILGGSHLGNAVDLGNRRLELAYRQSGDERHLRRYFSREAQERAFDALLDERSPAWALHYLGMGGIGKTMLLRRITSQIAPQRGLAVSRIDFDQLSPDYPVRRPGQLLLALAIELRPHVGSAGQRLVTYLADATQELHELLGAEPPPDDPLWNVTRPEFGKLLQIFADLLRSVPARVVLLLDTCEELARVAVVNKMLPAVEATFEILKRLHAEIPTLRVVLAGRRPLASSGYGWALREVATSSESPAGAGGAQTPNPTLGLRPYLTDRPFLALHEILGFTADEAHRFLTGPWELALERDGPLERAVFERSVETGRAVAIQRTSEDGPAREGAASDPAGDLLYSPFDLSLYGGWLTEDPNLQPEDVASRDSDPYVEVRIIQRLQPPALRSALPAIVALGRIDEQTLAEALPAALPADEAADLYRALADHEWMEQQRDPHTGQLFLEVEPNLVPRLRDYYAHDLRAAEAEAAQRKVAPRLAQTIRQSPLGELSVHQIDAALALLPADQAANLWTEVLVRVPVETEWSWLRNVTERLLGGEGAVSRQPTLAAGLTVAAATLQLHLTGAIRPPMDTEALVTLARWPDEQTRAWIVRLHRIWPIDWYQPAASTPGELVDLVRGFEAIQAADANDSQRWPRARSEAEAAALLQAVAGFADRLSMAEPEWAEWALLAETLTAWADVLAAHAYPVALEAMAEITGARLYVAAGQLDEAVSLVERALATVSDEAAVREANRRWLFWLPPDSIVDRVRLEALALHRDHLVGPPPDPQEWLVGSGALSRTGSIDAERLASAIEQWQLDRIVPERLELGVAEVADTYTVDRQPTVAVHRRTPPLFVTLAKKRSAIGDYDGADQRLRDRCREAEATRKDADTVWLATIARIEIARASRSIPPDLPAAVRGLDPGLLERSDARPAFALRALTGADLTGGFQLRGAEPWATLPVGDDRPAPANPSEPRPTPLPKLPHSTAPKGRGESEEEIGAAHEQHYFALQTIDRADFSLEHTLRGLMVVYGLGQQPHAVRPVVALRIARLLAQASGTAVGDVGSSLGTLDSQGSEPSLSTVLLDAGRALAEYLIEGVKQPPRPVTGPGPAEGPGRLIHIIGARRLATLAQDEGELLALWQPSAGARLLDLASRLAAYAGDEVARLDAEITAGLAAARQDEGTPASPLVREEWTRLTNQPPPALEHVEREWSERRLASSESGEYLSGWRIRHALLVALGTDPSGVLSFAESTSEWRRAFLHAVRQTPEVAFLATRAEAGRASTAAPAPAPASEYEARAPSSRTSILDQVLAFVPGIASIALLLWLVGTGALVLPPSSRVGAEPGLGVVAVVMLGMGLAMGLVSWLRPTLRDVSLGSALMLVGLAVFYALIGALADWVLPTPLGRWQRFFVVFGLLAAFGLMPSAYQRVWSWWRSRVARQSELSIGVSASSAPNLRTAETLATVSMTFDLTRVRTNGWRLPLRERQSWTNQVALPTVVRDPYDLAAAAMHREALRAVAEVHAELAGAEWTVPIRVDRAHQLPWEALFSHALPGGPTPDVAPFFYRVGAIGGAGHWSNRLAEAEVVVSVVGWNPEAVEAWTRAGREVVRDGEGRIGIVHAIGTPILSSAGPRFRLAGSTASVQGESAAEAAAEGPSSLNALFDLPYPLSLLILQHEPAFSSGRYGSDREQAALLRALAGEQFGRGHLAVITVPSLEPELADIAVKAIATRVSARRSRWRLPVVERDFSTARPQPPEDFLRLVHAVRAARRAMREWLTKQRRAEEDAGDERLEAAWDLCLFARYPKYSEGPATAASTARRS